MVAVPKKSETIFQHCITPSYCGVVIHISLSPKQRWRVHVTGGGHYWLERRNSNVRLRLSPIAFDSMFTVLDE